jgi:hypothetical protein
MDLAVSQQLTTECSKNLVSSVLNLSKQLI